MTTADTVLSMMDSEGRAGGFLLKSMIISRVLRVFSSRLLKCPYCAIFKVANIVL